jgi:hypothetical protein
MSEGDFDRCCENFTALLFQEPNNPESCTAVAKAATDLLAVLGADEFADLVEVAGFCHFVSPVAGNQRSP